MIQIGLAFLGMVGFIMMLAGILEFVRERIVGLLFTVFVILPVAALLVWVTVQNTRIGLACFALAAIFLSLIVRSFKRAEDADFKKENEMIQRVIDREDKEAEEAFVIGAARWAGRTQKDGPSLQSTDS